MPEQNFSAQDLPSRAKSEDAPYLVPSGEWEKLRKYMQLITVEDDGGVTSQAEETGQGIVLKRVT